MIEIKLDDIVPGPNQPRRTFYDGSLEELAQSIRERGVLEPIVVRPKDGKYEIVMGERRYRASRLAGLAAIPAIVKEMSDEDAATDALLENLQREDLNPVDRAKAIESLLRFMNWHECAKALGASESTLRRHLEVLELPEPVQRALIEAWDKSAGRTFTEAHARVLKALNGDLGTQIRLVEKINAEELSVPETKKIVYAIVQVPEKKEAFLRIPVAATEEIIKHVRRGRGQLTPFKPQTAERHLTALTNTAKQLSNLLDARIVQYLKSTQMNQLLNECTTLISQLNEITNELRTALRKGEDGFREVYIHCPLCGRIELIGSLKCSVCWSVLRRCLDCGNYNRIYQRCSITGEPVYLSEAESPRETSASYNCSKYKPLFEPCKVA